MKILHCLLFLLFFFGSFGDYKSKYNSPIEIEDQPYYLDEPNYSNSQSLSSKKKTNRKPRCLPIETPDQPERSRFVIRAPSGWAYRTFKGNNGLVGVLWPKGTSFSNCDTAVFVFIQDSNERSLPEIPDNVHIFNEKCPKAEFKFADWKNDQNKTISIEEKYFSGFCGRTQILFEEKVKNFRIITMLASSFYVSYDLFEDVKYIVSAYKTEVEDSLGIKNNKSYQQAKRNSSKNPFSSERAIEY